MYHYAYLLTFPNGMQYIGARSTNILPELDTTYLGSGRNLPKNRKDTKDVSKVILSTFTNRRDLINFEIEFIKNNNCVKSDNWYNKVTSTFDRHGSKPWNKGISGIPNTHTKTFIDRYCTGYRTPAQLAAKERVSKKLTGVACPERGHKGITNSGFKPWYYITPDGEYVEVYDVTKGDMASKFGVTQRQLINRFHKSNEHRKARYPVLRGYTFGNLPRPTDLVED